MSILNKLFKQTFIYGLATVLPRILSFILVPFHTGVMNTSTYGETSLVFTFIAICNVVLAYGMETAFFRFFNKEEGKVNVVSTSLISIGATTLGFLFMSYLFHEGIAKFLSLDASVFLIVVAILTFDALTIIPFAWLRAKEKPMRYAIIKVSSVALNLLLNLFFLSLLPEMQEEGNALWKTLYIPDFQVGYVFLANAISSGIAFLWVGGVYLDTKYTFDVVLWKRMMRYAIPVLIAGMAYTINEVFDRYLLEWLLPAEISKSEIGKYSGCYKLAVFMTLFSTAFRLGIEPFFFSHADSKNPQKGYAQITDYFVIFGSIILLVVVVFADVIKLILIPNETYWEALKIVPFIVLANFFLGIYHNLSVWYKVTDKTRYGAFISVIGAIITLAINIIFIPKIGYMASAIATLCAYTAMMCLSYYLGKKLYPVPYNMRKILFYGGLSILFSFSSFYIFNRNLIVGSLMLCLFLGLIYKMEGDKLKAIFLKRGN
ncbi:oligosaccharide flippase family protein [Croceivirga sp. JEA036]|uniref:oligosaccharide flippase family protein n=1 Tax=Croceivirga sp. JEA036 TaxID=2721162 RepID=UPI001438B887|nr:oligosaccharide flippase family protein [Croceivirga sp. JEA036]NJB37113.1 oligosaccharide flippase family protein [Croceivirga sp. JEA036]